MIDILVPVLSRPDNAQKVADSIHAGTASPHIIVFLATRGDHDEIEACKRTGSIVHLIDGGPGEWARKINAGIEANYGKAEFFFTGADDLRFHPGWDTAAIARWEETGLPVIGTNDLGNPTVIRGQHATHSLIHCSYVEQGSIDDPTRLMHESYHHNWVDTEFVETAKSRGMFTFAFDSHVEHLHPFWGKGDDDRVYAQGRRYYHNDARLFRKRQRLWG